MFRRPLIFSHIHRAQITDQWRNVVSHTIDALGKPHLGHITSSSSSLFCEHSVLSPALPARHLVLSRVLLWYAGQDWWSRVCRISCLLVSASVALQRTVGFSYFRWCPLEVFPPLVVGHIVEFCENCQKNYGTCSFSSQFKKINLLPKKQRSPMS